jgi:hypothetical protein
MIRRRISMLQGRRSWHIENPQGRTKRMRRSETNLCSIEIQPERRTVKIRVTTLSNPSPAHLHHHPTNNGKIPQMIRSKMMTLHLPLSTVQRTQLIAMLHAHPPPSLRPGP